jgi:uncharacterized protein YidB (DUF937 family)
MSASRPSVFDALATDTTSEDPLDQRLLADVAARLSAMTDVNALQALLDDFRAVGFDADVKAWLAPGQSSSPPPLPVDAIDRVAALGHVFDRTWLDETARSSNTDTQTVARRLAALLPRAVKALTPRGEVPTQRALMIGLDGLRRKAAK